MDLSLSGLFSVGGLLTLGMLILLQAVLGFDNLLYISLESKRVEESRQSHVRAVGVGLAIVLRLVLLVVLLLAIDRMQQPLFTYGLTLNEQEAREAHPANDHALDHELQNWELNDAGSLFAGSFNIHSIVVLAGGIFIIYTAFKEIIHMLRIEHDPSTKETKLRSALPRLNTPFDMIDRPIAMILFIIILLVIALHIRTLVIEHRNSGEGADA